MQIVELYVAFHLRTPFREDAFAALGHVEAFGITLEEDWFFFDPNRYRLDLRIHHKHDDVTDQITAVQSKSRLILRVDPSEGSRCPPLTLMTCASQCAHLAGVRAFTPWGLERKLRAIGATEVYREKAKRRSRGQKRA